LNRTSRESLFLSALKVSFFLLAVVLAFSAAAQSVITDASAVAGSASPLNIVRWTGDLPEAAGRTVEVSFALYQYPTGGLALWSEKQSVKVGTDGRYSVLLGATSAEGIPQTLFKSGEAQWIEARLIAASGGDVADEAANETPTARHLLAAVPYAFKSMDAETLSGRAADDYVTREELTSSVTDQVHASLQRVTTSPVKGTLIGPGTAGYLPVWTAAATLGNSIVSDSGTSVGIGTNTPATMLDVNGASTLRGAVSLLASAATLAAGINSPALQLGASTYSSTSNAAVPQNFVWQAVSSGNNSVSPTANLALLFGSGTTTPAATGLSIAPNGVINFAPGQTFPYVSGSPGSSTGGSSSSITTVTAGSGLTGGGSSGNVTLALSGPVSTANGGTGATTSARALANLGIPTVSVLNYGAKGDGVTDDGSAINAALAANASAANTSSCVFFPAATYYTTQTITTGKGANICGVTGKGSIIKYHGTGVGLQIGSSLTFTGGRIENLTIESDGGNGAVGIQITQGTELVLRNIQVGGSPALKFAIGWNFIQTSMICDVCTSSWNSVGFHFAWGASANSSNEITGGNIWDASTAAFQIDDASELDIHDNWIEHTPTGFLFTNTSIGGTLAKAINILNNRGVTLSTTYADPKFIRVLGANSATALNAWSIHVANNTYSAGGTNSYCNQMDWTNTYNGSIGRFYFDHNDFSGCTVAGINSTTAAFNVYTDVSDRVEGTSPASPSLPMLAGTYGLIQPTVASVNISSSTGKAAQISTGTLTAPRTITLPDANSNTVQPLSSAPSGGCLAYIDANGVQHGAACASLSGRITFTAATSDNATILGVTSSSHCVFSAANSIAAAHTTQAYISAVSANAVTITHAPGEGETFDILCTSN
jgi:hypothetical protein